MRTPKTTLAVSVMQSLILVFALACLPSAGFARTWNVPAEIPTIQAGIDTAAVGDTVSIASGTYTWTGEASGDADGLIHMKSGVHLRSETGDPDSVTVDAEGLGRVLYFEFVDNTATVEGLTVTGGAVVVNGGGIYLYQSSPTILNCHITENHLTNLSAQGAGMCCQVDCNPVVTGCIFSRNTLVVPGAGGGGGLTVWSGCDPIITSCTFYANRGDLACQMLSWDNCHPQLDKCILAFGTYMQAVSCGSGATVTLTCSDVYGNEGGDWVDCIGGQAGINGNFSGDPLFCAPDSSDFHLMTDSPCIDAPECGQVGPYGHGCRQPNRWIVPLDAPTIQAGIDSAAAGDTVVVKCGTYYERIQMKSDIALMSETGDPDCVTIDAQSLGQTVGFLNLTGTAYLTGFTITGGAGNYGAGVGCNNASPEVENCVIVGNYANSQGGGILCEAGAAPTFTDCIVAGNASGSEGGGAACYSSTPAFVNCTFYDNSAPDGGGFNTALANVTLNNCIVAFCAQGAAFLNQAGSCPALACCDVYGNAGGDWVGCIASQESINGNFWADPLFCYPAGGDFSLHWTSPCVDTLGCGRVGALGLGCVARTWYVSTAGSDTTGDGTYGNPFATIQYGLDRAFWGDTVEVACGTYFEHDIVMKSGVLLTSDTGSWGCVKIDAEGAAGVFQCADLDSNTVIQGFLLVRGGNIADGGGMFISSSDLEVINCRFDTCYASARGGGMFITSSSPTLTNCFFYADSAGTYGGAICMHQSSAVLDDCIFTENAAALGAGAVDVSDGSSPVFQVCAFELNSSVIAGAVRVVNSSAAIRYCGIRRNAASQSGGGVYCDLADSVDFDHCLIHANTAGLFGGAIHSDKSTVEVTSSTLYANSAASSGSGIYSDTSNVNVDRSIIAFGLDDSAVGCDGTPPAFTCSDIYGNDGGDWTGCIADQEDINGNFSSDPAFCDSETGNFYLRGGSPCLDAPGCGLVGPLGRGYCERAWYVPSQAPSIQAGMDSAAAGDTVIVACGTYNERVTMKSGTYLISETGEAECVTIDGNSTGHVITCANLDIPVYIQGFTLTGGSGTSGGGLYAEYAQCDLVNCDLTGNSTILWGGGMLLRYVPDATLTNCRIYGNSALEGAGIIAVSAGLTLEDCTVEANSAGNYGGGIRSTNSSVALKRCVINGNSAGMRGGGICTWDGSATCDSCTFYGNDSPLGSGLWCSDTSVDLDNTILSFGLGGSALYCDGACSPALACCDVYGNEGGDWVGCIAGEEALNDNLSADPLFCNPDSGDFHVAGASLCIGGACGQIGVLGVGCEDPLLRILSIEDVGNDQGRNVRMTWRRSSFDAQEDTIAVSGYEVYRRQDEYLLQDGYDTDENAATGVLNQVPGNAPIDGARRAPLDGGLLAPQVLGWDYVGTVPAHGDSYYQYVAPTLCDSTVEGICWSVFFIRAASNDPFIYMDSEPDSGYSIDNLAPAPPPNLIMTSPTELAWDEVQDEDFNYYSVYGSGEPVLDETATLIGFTSDTTKDITGHEYDYYHVTATDFSGNEGEESSVGNIYSGIPDPGIPKTFALKQNRPNPFDATTVIGFDVPEAGLVSVTVFDARGRVVKVLADKAYEPGRHTAVWEGMDDNGNLVATGIYFVRMRARDFEDMKKVMLLK